MPSPNRRPRSAEARHEQLCRRLVRKARKFDAPSLMAALAALGYGEDAIIFKSRHGTSRAASLIPRSSWWSGRSGAPS
jgi:hypothetical protein